MEQIKSFLELETYLTSVSTRKKMAVANAVDSHTLEAVMHAVDKGVIEAYLVGDVASIENQFLFDLHPSPFVHIIDIPDVKEATLEAVRMVHDGECDILMKGLVNTDVILRAILDKEKGILKHGRVMTYNAALEIPNYHKMLFFSDPVVIPEPTKEQRVEMIKYAIQTAYKFGVSCPKVALIHATEVANPKIRFMQDYLDILDMWRDGYFGDVIMDGPIDIFLALDKERGAIKNVQTPVLGDADILIFPDFQTANAFYKGLASFANADMAGLLQGPENPVVLTSRSESVYSKFCSICMACILC